MKRYSVTFKSIQDNFLTFLLSIYKMVYSIDIYKSLSIDTGTVMKNLEIIKFIHDHLKTKKMRKHAVKKLHYLLRYVPNRYMIRQMYNEAVLENA